MTDVRIVCCHDALQAARDLRRKLSAEQFAVTITSGRIVPADIETARQRREAVIVMWSKNGFASNLLIQWAEAFAPPHLIEISHAPSWTPREHRRAPVIDFSNWKGAGGRAWNALEDRLRAVVRANEPPKPEPLKAAGALAAFSALAFMIAVVQRVQTPAASADAPDTNSDFAAAGAALGETAALEGLGGAMGLVEPSDYEPDLEPAHFRAAPDMIAPLAAPHPGGLTRMRVASSMTFSDPTLLDRLAALAQPLRDRLDNPDN